jgi:hypothetical protein
MKRERTKEQSIDEINRKQTAKFIPNILINGLNTNTPKSSFKR